VALGLSSEYALGHLDLRRFDGLRIKAAADGLSRAPIPAVAREILLRAHGLSALIVST
jgi:hypothetical protein